jgi:hypothetical protein
MKAKSLPTYNGLTVLMNCRSVSPKTWEHARQALIFYFTRRHGLLNAEDLAHETLAAILNREDYQFEKEEDFLRVCYGFAGHTLQTARREAGRDMSYLRGSSAAPCPTTQGLKDAELRVYLDEVFRLGRDELHQTDWHLIQRSILQDGDRTASNPAEANNARVKLHRARRRLAQLVGWPRR